MMICDICVFDLYGTHTRTWTGKSGNTYRKAVLVLVVVVYWMLLSVVPLSFCHLLNLLVRRTLYTPIGPTSPVPLLGTGGTRVQRRGVSLYCMPRGWPCPAGVGGDPRFPSLYMYVYPARDGGEAALMCSCVGGALRRPHMIAADVFPAHSPHTPYPLPDVDHSTLATTQRMLLTLRAYPTVEDELSARPPAYE